MPEDFDDSSLHQGPVSFFKQFGYKVPQYFSEVYERYNGIHSDKYLSTGLYNYTITPYLMNLNLIQAYDDKNVYSMLFPDVFQPKTILKNMNGRYYKPDNCFCVGAELTKEEAVDLIRSQDGFLCKSAMETGGGRSIKVYQGKKLTKEDVLRVFDDYDQNFIIQEILVNHFEMAKLNPTSLNTCRLVTYRRPKSSNYVLLGAFVRFGSSGAFVDNASSGGGFCKVFSDGSVDDVIRSFKSFDARSLKKEKSIDNFVVPYFETMKKTAFQLHRRLPYCDLIGWDFAVTDSDSIALVEYNYRPDLEAFQISQGPLFGDYTEELMECLSCPIVESVIAFKRSFKGVSHTNKHIFDLEETDKL